MDDLSNPREGAQKRTQPTALFEVSIGDEAKLREFVSQLERASHSQLLDLAKGLARQVLVVQPAVNRGMMREALRRRHSWEVAPAQRTRKSGPRLGPAVAGIVTGLLRFIKLMVGPKLVSAGRRHADTGTRGGRPPGKGIRA